MKPIKSIVLLAAGVLALSACDKKADNQTTATGTQDTTMGAGTAGTNVDAAATGTTDAANLNETSQGSGTGDDSASAAGAGAAIGAGAGAAAAGAHDHNHGDESTTSEGSGAISDEAASEELNRNPGNLDDGYADETEVEEEEYTGSAIGSDRGTGASSENMEYVDETSSEPDNVEGGRDGRMVPRNNRLDNTSSEPDNIDR